MSSRKRAKRFTWTEAQSMDLVTRLTDLPQREFLISPAHRKHYTETISKVLNQLAMQVLGMSEADIKEFKAKYHPIKSKLKTLRRACKRARTRANLSICVASSDEIESEASRRFKARGQALQSFYILYVEELKRVRDAQGRGEVEVTQQAGKQGTALPGEKRDSLWGEGRRSESLDAGAFISEEDDDEEEEEKDDLGEQEDEEEGEEEEKHEGDGQDDHADEDYFEIVSPVDTMATHVARVDSTGSSARVSGSVATEEEDRRVRRRIDVSGDLQVQTDVKPTLNQGSSEHAETMIPEMDKTSLIHQCLLNCAAEYHRNLAASPRAIRIYLPRPNDAHAAFTRLMLCRIATSNSLIICNTVEELDMGGRGEERLYLDYTVDMVGETLSIRGERESYVCYYHNVLGAD